MGLQWDYIDSHLLIKGLSLRGVTVVFMDRCRARKRVVGGPVVKMSKADSGRDSHKAGDCLITERWGVVCS